MNPFSTTHPPEEVHQTTEYKENDLANSEFLLPLLPPPPLSDSKLLYYFYTLVIDGLIRLTD